MISFPFTSQVSYDADGMPLYDRAADSAVLRGLIKRYFSTGVFGIPATGLQITAGEGMTVTVLPGAFNIEGVTGWEDSNRTLALEAADALDRIDLVVLRLDDSLSARKTDLYIVKGVASDSPAAPTLTRNSTVYELCLAQVFVPAGSTAVTTARITDTRLNTELCGTVGYALGAWSADPYFEQIQALVTELEGVIGGVLDGSEYMLKTEYAGSAAGVVKDSDALGGKPASAFATMAQGLSTDAMPLSGGTFTGNAVAISSNRAEACLRNIDVVDAAGNLVSTNSIRCVRK